MQSTMKRLILFIAAAIVSVATVQAQSRDVVDIVKSILPKEFVAQQTVAESAVVVEEPEVVEEPVASVDEPEVIEVTTVEVANNNVADIVQSLIPADFRFEHGAAKSVALSELTPEEEIMAYAESESAIKTRFLPMRQRVDRKVVNNKFVYKGEVMLGLTASYGRVSSEDSDLMLLLDGIDIGLRSATIRPFFAYAYRDNLAVGLRLGYEYLKGDLSNIDLNLGLIAEGMEGMSIGNLSLRSETFSWALFHRHYLGLDSRGIVGVILETELLFKDGTSRFVSGGEAASGAFSRNFAAQLNVNPGIGVYIFPQACVTATVGIGGLRYNNIRQCNALGEVVGRRDHSSLNFKLNILDIQIGVVMHLWNNKK